MPPPPQYAPAAASPAQGMAYPNPPYGSDPGQPNGTPNHMQAQSGLAHQNQAPARTVLGMTAPVPPQLGGNATGPQQMPPQQSGPYPQQQHAQHPSGPMQQPYPQQAPYRPSGPMQQQPYPQAQYPQYQQGPYPSGSMPGYNPPGYGYPGSGPMQATPIDHLQPQAEGKRSTLIRDILIGVAIAALVLGGFFVVKIFILDKNDDAQPTTTTSTIATIHISMAAGITADLIVDDKKIATVRDGLDVPVSAGQRHVVLAGPNGGKCETNVKLEAGKTTPLKCQLTAPPPPPPETGSATGSAVAPAATGSAGSAATPASTGSAATPAPATGSGAGSAAKAATASTATTQSSSSTTTAAIDKSGERPTRSTAGGGAEVVDKTITRPATPKTETKVATAEPKTEAKTEAKIEPKIDATRTAPKTDKKIEAVDPKATADTSGKGYLVITSKPSAKIAIDGVDTGRSTPISGTSMPLAPGKHKVTFIMGDDRYTFPVTIGAGKTERLDKDLQ
jgi:hypothetical protein